jgi:cyclic-di-AMP phosphodiesterase PgpH
MMPWRTSRRKLRPSVNEADTFSWAAQLIRAEGVAKSLLIALAFAMIASVILMMRAEIVGYRPGQYASSDIVARVEFDYFDNDKLEEARRQAAIATPRVFKESRRAWDEIEQSLLTLPDRLKGQRLEDIPDIELGSTLDNATLARLQEYAEPSQRAAWDESVRKYVSSLRKLGLVVIDAEVRRNEIALGRSIVVPGLSLGHTSTPPQYTFTPEMGDEIYKRLQSAAGENFSAPIWPKIALLTKLNLSGAATHEIDETATQQAENTARSNVPRDQGLRRYARNQPVLSIKPGETGRAIQEADYALLKAENRAFRESLGRRAMLLEYLGLVGCVCLITLGMCVYVTKYAPRVIRNHARAVGLAALLLSTLLIAELTAIGTNRLFFSGVAPTILCAMILAIAYDQRFAIGMAALHAMLVTMAVGQDLPFFLVLVSGAAVCVFSVDDLRSRSKLIEVGGLTAIVLMAATAFSGLISNDAFEFVLVDALYAGAAGLSVGFIVLGILPFVERAFRITTSMTLLELADTGHPLLRKLAHEAPGTYNHSMQVANLAEEATEAIGGKALLARVGAYYHDIGKMNKPDYFVENQAQGQPNRHLTLNPNVSLLIIVGHVKDGIELAREYNLPTALFPFIQSHHGTTLVEYFYWRAVKQEEARTGDEADIPEHQFRYPGPRPRSKEVGVVMLSDAVESICRTLDDPTASRIEAVVRDVVMKRLADGQFDDCDITQRELHLVEKSLARTLMGIYHARIAYPGDQSKAEPAPATQDGRPTLPSERTA